MAKTELLRLRQRTVPCLTVGDPPPGNGRHTHDRNRQNRIPDNISNIRISNSKCKRNITCGKASIYNHECDIDFLFRFLKDFHKLKNDPFRHSSACQYKHKNTVIYCGIIIEPYKMKLASRKTNQQPKNMHSPKGTFFHKQSSCFYQSHRI